MSRIIVFTHAGGSPMHGPNMRWYYMGQSLRSLGYKTTIISASWFHKYHTPPTSESVPSEVVKGIEYEWIKTRSYRKRGGLKQVLNQWDYVRGAWKRATKIDHSNVRAVVASSPHPFAIYPALRFARRAGVPLIYEVRDLWPLLVIELGASKFHPYMLFMSMTERFAVRSSDMVMSVKKGDIEYFSDRYGLQSEKFTYLPNGFTVTEKDHVEPVGRRRSSETTIGYTGALDRAYQLDCLIEAARHFVQRSSMRFVLVGRGEEEERLRDRVSSQGLTNVEFVGFRPKEEIREWLDSFDICYIGHKDGPAHRYGISSNKLFEYMAAGKPVVASYNTQFDPVREANCGITVTSGDADGLVKAIQWLKDHPERAKEMGENGRHYFLENHEFSVVAKKFVEVLDSLQRSRQDVRDLQRA